MEHANIMFAVAWWSMPIAANRLKDGATILELRRMAVVDDAPRFTASRFLSVMTKIIKRERLDITRLISYQDVEVHTGTIYKASGWEVGRAAEFSSWKNRPGRSDQSDAPKVRWEKQLRPSCPTDKIPTEETMVQETMGFEKSKAMDLFFGG